MLLEKIFRKKFCVLKKVAYLCSPNRGSGEMVDALL